VASEQGAVGTGKGIHCEQEVAHNDYTTAVRNGRDRETCH